MSDNLIVLLSLVVPYFFGSINSAIIISKKYLKDDIRIYGSKNAGMTNVLRVIGKKAAFYTIVGDVGKAFIPVLIFKIVFTNYTNFDPIIGSYFAAISALIGHIFPIYYGFKGGKGVLTAAGAIAAINIWVLLILLGVFLVVAFSTRVVSIGSILISILFPFVSYFIQKSDSTFTLNYLYYTIIMSLILIYMHRANIVRIINGTENKFSNKK
ncbi:MAG: glycerol-3-phosphate 1-O-acyltransferase PlsY [Oscillospiraceae bacterium]